MWSQTPQFDLLLDSSDDIGIDMNVRHGIIKSLDFKDSGMSIEAQEELRGVLVEQKLQDIRGWEGDSESLTPECPAQPRSATTPAPAR